MAKLMIMKDVSYNGNMYIKNTVVNAYDKDVIDFLVKEAYASEIVDKTEITIKNNNKE